MAEGPKYKVLHELGAGGMGLIWRGLLVGQAGFQRPIVVKQIKNAGDPGHVRLFVDEARRYAVLDHENIGRIFDFDRVSGELCILLEYIDGWTLGDLVDRCHSRSQPVDVDLSVFIASRVCRALQYVFERAAIVHRDISPSNIMMTREGTVKLIDFGIATQSGTRDYCLTGKPAYMAPEMVIELRADNRSDVFSLGAVLFELLTGSRLFPGDTAAEVLGQVVAMPIPSVRARNPSVPEAVDAIVARALQRVPGARFASAGEMGEACEHHLYDKGYGPTNLTLKRYLAKLFPEAEAAAPLPESAFPIVDSTLLPISGDPRFEQARRREGTGPSGGYTRVVSQRPHTTARSAVTEPMVLRPAAGPDGDGAAATVPPRPAKRRKARRAMAAPPARPAASGKPRRRAR
jgi:serine/threonine-protein kinase